MYFSGAALRKCVECDATLLQQIIACAINAKRLPSERIAMHARIHSLVATQKDCSLQQRDVFSDFDHNFISAYMSEVVDEHTKRPERNGPKPERLLRLEETLKQLSASFNSRFWRDFVQVRMSSDVDRVNKLRPTTAATDNARSWFVKRM